MFIIIYLLPLATAITMAALSVGRPAWRLLLDPPRNAERTRKRAQLLAIILAVVAVSLGASMIFLTRVRCDYGGGAQEQTNDAAMMNPGAASNPPAARRRAITPRDLLNGRGRGFLMVADGGDLARATAAARALRAFGRTAGRAEGQARRQAVSITLLTDDFGVRSFRAPEAGASNASSLR